MAKNPRNQDQVPHQGRQSGKSSTRWFGASAPRGTAAGDHGYGARAGDGKTSNKSILGKIVPKFLRGE